MDNKGQRLYNVKDDQLIIHSEVIRDRYLKYEPHFKTFNDVKFNDEYHAGIDAKITTASNTMSDAFIVKTQAKETAEVSQASTKLLSSLEGLCFIIKSAFAGNEIVLNEMRIKELKSIARNPDSFIIFTQDLFVKVEKYKEKLIPEGLKDEHLTTIKEDLAELNKQRREQIDAIQSRPAITQDRIVKMNDLWRKLVELRDASNIVFKDQPEIQALFALPKSNGSSHTGNDIPVNDEEEIVGE